jgi:peptidoglycan/xylan/chitin deacetylase (PgdA/CDA1 family)
MPELEKLDRPVTTRALRSRTSRFWGTAKRERTIVTTSWDDGDYADLKLAELLMSRGIRGTFYVPITYRERPLSESQLRDLASEGFEIGAHGFSHKPLWRLPPPELDQEVGPCKSILEDIIGSEVRMFCYPCGRYDANVVHALQKAGYWGARTVRMLATRPAFNPFEMPTTLQIFPHPHFTYLANVARTRRLESLQTYLVQRSRLGSWLQLGKRLFDEVLEKGGIWHLYGHSWEIEKLGLWGELREILDYVGRREGVTYVPNCELVPTSAKICWARSQFIVDLERRLASESARSATEVIVREQALPD